LATVSQIQFNVAPPEKKEITLRKSPLLWQRHLTTSLGRLSFNPVPQELYVLANNGIIAFSYVDNIILAYRKRQEGEAQ